MPTTATGSPTGASSVTPMPFIPSFCIAAEATRLVDVPYRKIIPPSIDAYASGSSTLLLGTLARCAAPMATGRKAAVVTVLEMTDEKAATAPIIASTNTWWP